MAASAARSILLAQRRPSYVFPSSPANMNPSQVITSGNAQSPLIFTPSSSFVHPPTLKANTPPSTNNISDVENFLSVIEQAQNLRITSGQIDKKSSLKESSKLTSSVMASVIIYLIFYELRMLLIDFANYKRRIRNLQKKLISNWLVFFPTLLTFQIHLYTNNKTLTIILNFIVIRWSSILSFTFIF